MLNYEFEYEFDGEFEADWEAGDYEPEEFLPAVASLLPTVAPMAINAVRSLLKESEMESDFEADFEFESDFESAAPPSTRALMNHLGHLAAQTDSEAEAEAFIGALAGLAAKAAAPMIAKAAPTLIKGVARVGRQLLSSPKTKPLVRTLPKIAEGTTKTLSNHVSRGGALDSQTALRALAKNTSQVLQSPQQTAKAMRQSRPAPAPGRRRRSKAFRSAQAHRLANRLRHAKGAEHSVTRR